MTDKNDVVATVKKEFPSYAEASAAARKLGIKTKKEYKQAHRDRPEFPSTPEAKYSSEWKDWKAFLGIK